MCTHNPTRHAKSVTTTIVSGMALLTLTLFAPAALAQSRAFTVNGASASEFNCSVSSSTVECIEVFVSRSSSPAPLDGLTGTFLDYEHYVADLNTGAFQDFFGFGIIPDSAFQVRGKSSLLSVNTNLAGFSNGVCTFDPSGTASCNSAPGGDVTGNWTEFSPPITFRRSGTSRFSSPSVTFISTGTSESNAAIANVSVLGGVASNVTGDVGTQHNTTITIEHH